MSVALIDQDCLNNKKDFFYDLDIMKLASYYKSKKEITKLLLDPTQYYQYSKIYFIKNRFDYKLFKDLFLNPKIIYRGYAFSADRYEPMEEEIENSQADITIYDTYLKFNDDLAKRRIPKLLSERFVNGLHVRFSLDGISCNAPDKILHYKKAESLCIYDYNLFQLEGWKERLCDFKDFLIRFKFPPITYEIEELKYILNNFKIYNENHFILGGNITKEILEEIISFGKEHKDRIKIEIFNDLNFSKKEVFQKQIINALNNVLALKKAKTRIHSFINPHNIDERTAYINTVAYWNNRNHSDVSFNYFLTNIRKQNTATRNFNEIAKENDEIRYLINVKPSEWRGSSELY